MAMLHISPRTLAAVALDSACPRCAWLTLRCEGKFPFAMGLPGIFSSIDSFTKREVRNHFDLYQRLPDWFPDVGKVAEMVPSRDLHWNRFFREDLETRIRLQGTPDDILRMADGGTHIVDYKTARLTEAQDDLMPVYEVQLNGYAYIADATGYGPVAHLSLIYFEPQTETTLAPPSGAFAAAELFTQPVAPPSSHGPVLVRSHGAALHDLGRGGAWLEFRARRKEVPMRGSHGIRELLVRARALFDRADPPASAAGCEDCCRLAEIWKLLS
jgi:hypothetical protein